jgi:hypothetical protein
MIKSWCSSENPKAEWKAIRTPSHVAKIRAAIDKNFARYFYSLVHPAVAPAQGADLLARLGEKYKVTPSSKPAPTGTVAPSVFVKSIADHHKKAERYRGVFEPEVLQEFRSDDPDAFKTHLSRKCPVIVSLLQSHSSELKDWMMKYRLRTSEDLLSVFENLLAFAQEYMDELGVEKTYSTLETADALALDEFDTEELSITGVVGSGIKSLALYHLYPRVFPALGGRSVFALYFLTDKSTFDLRSKTSEFLIVNDGKEGKDVNIAMDHNYWYPYSQFTEYAMQVARSIQAECAARGIDFDVEYRYVYANAFFEHICDIHAADLKVMAGVDEMREQIWASK